MQLSANTVHRSSRILELDGLRALSILGVLAIHANGTIAPGGHLGVTVFFVLSGYLITTILIRERDDAGRIDFASFYVRRGGRLFPALAVVLVVAGLFSLTLDSPTDVARGVASAAFYVANIVAANVGGEGMANFDWAWTLSLEEQFYFLWPVLLVTVLRRPAAAAVFACFGIVIAEVFRAAGALGEGVPGMFYAPQTRMSGLFLGALLALFLHRHSRRMPTPAANVAGTVAAGTIAAGFLLAHLDARTTYTIWIPLAEVAAATLIWVCLRGSAWFMPVLRWKPLVYLGAISYGVYLWNIPVSRAVHELALPAAAQQLLVVGTTIVVAAASFELIEKRANRAIRQSRVLKHSPR